MSSSITDRRWAKAAGFPDLSRLTNEEAEEFDSICFGMNGPDQVPYPSDKLIERWKQLKAKIEDQGPVARPWAEYIEAEVERLMTEAGPDLCLAMIHSRAIESPESYKRLKPKDEAKAHFGITKAGYWERVALRALVLLKVPLAEREKLIAEALAREEAALAAVAERVKRGPGGPYREVDLSSLEL